MGIQDCVYDNINLKRGIGTTLRKGEACNFCRLARANVSTAKGVLTAKPPFPNTHQDQKEGKWMIFVSPRSLDLLNFRI